MTGGPGRLLVASRLSLPFFLLTQTSSTNEPHAVPFPLPVDQTSSWPDRRTTAHHNPEMLDLYLILPRIDGPFVHRTITEDALRFVIWNTLEDLGSIPNAFVPQGIVCEFQNPAVDFLEPMTGRICLQVTNHGHQVQPHTMVPQLEPLNAARWPAALRDQT